VAREVGVSKHTIYAWKAKYGGMDVSQAQEAKQLRDENTRLRKLVADLRLDKEALQSVPKNRVELVAWKAAVGQTQPSAPRCAGSWTCFSPFRSAYISAPVGRSLRRHSPQFGDLQSQASCLH
jgi:putative transposase